MSATAVFRAVLPGLLLIVAAGKAQAQADQDCQNFMQPPSEQRAACDEAIEAATDPLEHARLLVHRAGAFRRDQAMDGTYDREQNQDMVDEALADIAEAERLAPDADLQLRADLLVERSLVYRVQGDLEAALADTEEAERLTPNDADPVINRALLLADQGDVEGALAQLARARELEPDSPRAHLASMLFLYEAGELETCVESGNRLVELAPTDVRVWSARGLCLAELGRTEEALADLEEAKRLGPYNIVTFEDMNLAYLTLDRPEDALAVARQAVKASPKEEGPQILLVNALVATGAVDEAIAAYRDAQAAGIEDTIGLSNSLAWSLYLEGHHEKALPIIEEWLAAHPEPAGEQYYQLDTAAHIMAAAGRRDEAVDLFLKAAELGGPELRSMYEEGLTTLGFAPEPGDEGFEAALRACVATGEACKLV